MVVQLASVKHYLLLHVPISLLLSLPDSSRRALYGHLIQLEKLLTQAVLQVLVEMAAGTQNVKHVGSHNHNRHCTNTKSARFFQVVEESV